MAALADRAAVRLAIFSLLALVVLAFLAPHVGAGNEFRDAQVLALHEHAALDAVRRFGELPLWNPYYCGGFSALGAAQSRFASPLFVIDLVFGAERGEALVVHLLLVLGMEGTFRWLRLRVTDASAVLRVAPVFALSGQFAVALHRGWTHFFGFELAPWMLYGITLAARGRRSGVAIAAGAFTIGLGFGGTFAAPLLTVAAVVEAARAWIEAPRAGRGRVTLGLLLTAVTMLGLSAFRLWPLAETLAASPRIMAGAPGHHPVAILGMLVGSLRVADGDVGDVGQLYVGAGFLVLFLLGTSDRRGLAALAIVVVFAWLGAGYARTPSLFALLRELPIFEALRYPERFLWIGMLWASEPAARALGRIPRLGEGPAWRRGSAIVLSVVLGFSIVSELAAFRRVVAARQLGVFAVDRRPDFRQARGNRWLAGHVPGLGVGSLSCWEPYPVVMSPRLRADLLAEEYLRDPEAGLAKRTSWSPNRLGVHVNLRRPTRLIVNQNWHPGWHTSVGAVVSEDGLLAVDLPRGVHDVALRFRPRSALAGALTTLTTIAALIAARRRRLVLLAPVLVAGACVATWDEPRYSAPPPQNPDGSPALVAAVPADAPKPDATFALPLAIEGARVGPLDALETLPIEVYLRRTGRMPRTTAMFVRVVRRGDPEGKPIALDHQVVGGAFFLSTSPKDVLVRDTVAVSLHGAARGTYDVWIAFGHVAGKRGYVAAAGRDAVERRVRIGAFELQ